MVSQKRENKRKLQKMAGILTGVMPCLYHKFCDYMEDKSIYWRLLTPLFILAWHAIFICINVLPYLLLRDEEDETFSKKQMPMVIFPGIFLNFCHFAYVWYIFDQDGHAERNSRHWGLAFWIFETIFMIYYSIPTILFAYAIYAYSDPYDFLPYHLLHKMAPLLGTTNFLLMGLGVGLIVLIVIVPASYGIFGLYVFVKEELEERRKMLNEKEEEKQKNKVNKKMNGLNFSSMTTNIFEQQYCDDQQASSASSICEYSLTDSGGNCMMEINLDGDDGEYGTFA